MRIEIYIFIITAFLIWYIYTDGKYVKNLWKWKKYYQMAGIAVGGLFFYWLFKQNPLSAHQMITTTNDYIKYLPLDSNTTSILSPILDFTSKNSFGPGVGGLQRPVVQMGGGGGGGGSAFGASQNNPVGGPAGGAPGAETRIMRSGNGKGGATKRSVSETKKKFVAARQNWHCGDCQTQLSAWFEVDHKVRLEYGGSNHVDNLVALCRECHGKKTAMENL
jgi:hypothetical protein